MQKELDPDFSEDTSVSDESTPISDDSIRRLRLRSSKLISEVESLVSLGCKSTPRSRPLETRDRIKLHEEIKQFEITLIKNALYRTGGHQGRAAAFLNLNSSTLNEKIRQHSIRCLLSLS
jgi:DNA-binding NtrC family response regulator